MKLKRAHLSEPYERRLVVADDEVDLADAVHANRLRSHPVGRALGDALLVEALPIDAVGEAHARQWPLGQVGNECVGDARVVVDRLALGRLRLRPHDLVEVGQGESPAVDLDLSALVRHGALLSG